MPAIISQRPGKSRLYAADGTPVRNFNNVVRAWLRDEVAIREHNPPAAFDYMRTAYDLEVEALSQTGMTTWQAHRALLSDLTRLMFGDDISGRLSQELSGENINPAGFRSALTQSVAKNTGENFINAIAYGLANALADQDEVLVDKGMAPVVRDFLTMSRTFSGTQGQPRTISIPVEADLTIWARHDPATAIIVNAKTRLKEIFHIATMWKLLYDMIGDDYCRQKWGMTGPSTVPDMTYVFATADMIRPTGTRTQGPDVERAEVRNLIAMDASFFDYVFVSKSGIGHVASSLDYAAGREALFHEMGCLLDLVEQRFGMAIEPSSRHDERLF